jgi:hypothetical protein
VSARSARRRRQEAPELPAYLTRILEAHARGAIPTRPGSVNHIYVSHREDCPFPRRLGRCICRADQLDLEVRTYPIPPEGGAVV